MSFLNATASPPLPISGKFSIGWWDFYLYYCWHDNNLTETFPIMVGSLPVISRTQRNKQPADVYFIFNTARQLLTYPEREEPTMGLQYAIYIDRVSGKFFLNAVLYSLETR